MERIVLEVAANPDLVSYPDAGDRQLWYRAILSELRNERERCAKVAEAFIPAPRNADANHSAQMIAATIREGR